MKCTSDKRLASANAVLQVCHHLGLQSPNYEDIINNSISVLLTLWFVTSFPRRE